MGDIALVNGDIVVSQFDDISLVLDDNEDILQQAINNINTIYGEVIDHPTIGNMLFNNRNKIKSDLSDIETYCEDAISSDERIDSVEDIVATRVKDTDMVNISFTLLTIYGDTISSSSNISIT